ncbi:hypothetical protein [Thalassotalea montiporae]
MNTEPQDTNDELANFQRLVTKVIIGIALFFALIVTVHIYNFFITGKADQEAFAQFGDYIGGLLNPVLGFSTVLLLIYSIRIQGQELRNTTEELKLTRQEMKLANEEAKKSAKAMLRQSELMEQRDRIEQINKVIEQVTDELDKIFEIQWEVPRDFVAAHSEYYSLSRISINQLIGIDEKVSMGVYHEGSEQKKGLDIYTRYLSTVEHSRGEYYSKLVAKDVLYGSRLKLNRLGSCLSELIATGLSVTLCQKLVDDFSLKLKGLEHLGMISSMFSHSCFNSLQDSVSERKRHEPRFRITINRDE